MSSRSRVERASRSSRVTTEHIVPPQERQQRVELGTCLAVPCAGLFDVDAIGACCLQLRLLIGETGGLIRG